MQTLHALLLHVENDAVTLQRELTLTMARNASALIVRRDGPKEIRLGIGEPGSRLFNERDWLLAFGPDSGQRLDIAQIRKLAFAAEAKREADALYAPPVSKRELPGAGRRVFGECGRFCADGRRAIALVNGIRYVATWIWPTPRPSRLA